MVECECSCRSVMLEAIDVTIFGKKQPGQPGGSSGGGSGPPGGGRTFRSDDFPWSNRPDAVACNLAFGDLARNLPARMAVDGRIHAETLLAAAGAIAGFAAQSALDRNTPGMQTVTTKDGSNYLFGEPLNEMLFARNAALAPERLWNLASGTAVALGASLSALPRMEPMFAHVSQVIGSEQEGLPSLPSSNHPHLPVKQLLPLVWPLALNFLSGGGSGAQLKTGPVDVRNWPAITARTAAAMMNQVKEVIDPVKSLTIVMESAIYASKLPPHLAKAGNSGT